MWNPVVILVLCLWSFTHAVPLGLKKNMAIVQEEEEPMLMMAGDEETRPEVMISRLNLPSNATSIRADITDGFSCDNKTYGYYADVENECQIFHVCLPVTYADGKENTFRWSFICPEETVFSQDSFTCMRPEDMSIDCEESFKYYELNRNFGVVESEDNQMSVEDEMNMEELSRQPSSQELTEEKLTQTMVAPPVKKHTNKVQSWNRRKTQTNRINSETQRKPLRKIPQPAALPTTTKTVEEEAPMPEQEAERTTVKYQRFNKRPVTAVKEQPKPEPVQQFVRQELFTQKRKRPQTYSGSRFDTPIPAEGEESQKTDFVLQAQPELEPEPLPQAQAEAQASEIAEVSVKPQVEKIAEPKPIEAEKAESLAADEKEPIADLKSEIAPLPENTPSRVEVVEIPIQKVDAPLVVEAPAVLVPVPEDPKPMADVMAPMKAEEETPAAEEPIAEEMPKAVEVDESEPEAAKMAAEIPAESDEETEVEKVLLEPLAEPGLMLEGNEPEKLLETVKAAEPEVLAPEPVKPAEVEAEAEAEAEVPAPAPETALKIESSPPAEPEPAPEAAPEKPSEDEMPMKVEVPAELEAEPEVLLKAETPIAEQPQESEVPAPEMPLLAEAPPQLSEMPAAAEPEPEAQKPLEADVPAVDMEMTKAAEILPAAEVPMEVSMDLAEKPAEDVLPAEPMAVLSPKPLESEQPEGQLEKSAELQEEAMQTSDQVPNAEEMSQPTAAEAQDAQTLILDFISSLVNSESSNMEEQSANVEEMPAESAPEPAVSELKLTEEKPAEAEPAQEEPKPMYMPLMQNTDQMYQIPVQVIETPEPEMPMPAPVEAEPKLPLSIDDVVELVKESLDTPAEKENLVQEAPASQPEPQSNSDEVKPIYHRYFELGSNLLKSEALTASDEEEPKITSNDKPMEDEQPQAANTMDASPAAEPPSASEQQPEPVKLASEPEPMLNSLPPAEAEAEAVRAVSPTADRLSMSRSMNRFKMDPRKRRFLFRSDAS